MDARYFCQNLENGFPATIAETPLGKVRVINWARDVSPEWTPEERCRVVSERFQKYANNGVLNYLTTGRMNGQNVICIASERNGDCARQLGEQGLLFTITTGKSPEAVLLNLMEVARFKDVPPINESEGDRVYIDINKFLEQTASQRANLVESNQLNQDNTTKQTPCFQFGC